jgi:preprotein translocase subunit SecD
MATYAKVLGAAAVLTCTLPWASGIEPGDNQGVRFEIRLAETQPAKGLTEAIVEGTTRKVYLHKEAALTNKDVAMAQATTRDGDSAVIDVRLTEDGAKKLAKLTANHVGQPLAIMLDGKVLAAPVVRDPITGGKALITGNFTKEEAARIAGAINTR